MRSGWRNANGWSTAEYGVAQKEFSLSFFRRAGGDVFIKPDVNPRVGVSIPSGQWRVNTRLQEKSWRVFGGVNVLASRRRCALTRQNRLVSSLAPPNCT
jgi:hypothetical protein